MACGTKVESFKVESRAIGDRGSRSSDQDPVTGFSRGTA